MARRRSLIVLAGLAAALLCAPLAFALPGRAQYSGKSDLAGTVRIRLSKDGHAISKLRIYYKPVCQGASGNVTYTDVTNAPLSGGHFSTHGTYVGSSDKLNNSFKVSGSLGTRHGHGKFSLVETNADGSVHCQSGALTFKVNRV